LEVVGDGEESDFCSYFFKTSEHKPSESLVLFDVAEYRFYLPSLFSSLDSFFAFQQFSYFLAMAGEIGRALDDAIAGRVVAGASHRAAFAVPGLVEPVRLDKAVCRLSRPIANVRHWLAYRTGDGTRFGVVIQIVHIKGFPAYLRSLCCLSK